MFLTSESELVLSTENLTLVLYSTKSSPFLNNLLFDFTDPYQASLVFADVFSFPSLIRRFNLTVLPTIIVFREGKERQRILGPLQLPLLRDILESEKTSESTTPTKGTQP